MLRLRSGETLTQVFQVLIRATQQAKLDDVKSFDERSGGSDAT